MTLEINHTINFLDLESKGINPTDIDEAVNNLWIQLNNSNQKIRFDYILLWYSQERKDINEAIKEWEMVKEINDTDIDDTKCICSHDIKFKFYITNLINDNILRVGSDCIGKLNSDRLNKEMLAVKYIGKKRQCKDCGHHKISPDKESWITRCVPCYRKYKNMKHRNCLDCNKYMTDKDVTYCQSCYLEHKIYSEMEYRECEICKKRNIHPKTPAYVDKCVSCYIDFKNNK